MNNQEQESINQTPALDPWQVAEDFRNLKYPAEPVGLPSTSFVPSLVYLEDESAFYGLGGKEISDKTLRGQIAGYR